MGFPRLGRPVAASPEAAGVTGSVYEPTIPPIMSRRFGQRRAICFRPVRGRDEIIFRAVFSLFAGAVLAQDLAPDALVKKISDEVIGIIKQDKDILAGNQKKINELVEAKVLPHFNFERMTALAVGRNWPKASAEQQKILTSEFRTLLVRTYSAALTTYRNQVIEFKPLRAAAGDTEVMVRTQVKQTGAEPVGIDYSMEKTPGGWKVYDIVVGGVSLVTNYRETFNTEIRDGGVDGLIKSLASQNRALDRRPGQIRDHPVGERLFARSPSARSLRSCRRAAIGSRRAWRCSIFEALPRWTRRRWRLHLNACARRAGASSHFPWQISLRPCKTLPSSTPYPGCCRSNRPDFHPAVTRCRT
jgi:phospholipid transport system substrate-binding protein